MHARAFGCAVCDCFCIHMSPALLTHCSSLPLSFCPSAVPCPWLDNKVSGFELQRIEHTCKRAGVQCAHCVHPLTVSSAIFFLCILPRLSQHTVFGRVLRGMDVVHSIEKAKTINSKPITPIKIVSIEINK